MEQQKKISIFDTTLRDGNQAVGIGFSLADKLKIAERLNEFGVDYIEGGWPNPTNQIDRDFYKEILTKNFTSKITVFGSTRRPNVKASEDSFMHSLLETGTSVATIFGKSWDLHAEKVIRCSLEENVDMIGSSVEYLKSNLDEVVYDAEHFFDGYKRNPEYALQTLKAAEQAGADVLVLCDTNGGCIPSEITTIVTKIIAATSTPVGVHLHNDSGCAVANSLTAVEAGAVHVQGTINGIGERCGNANLCSVIPGLQLKQGYRIINDEQMESLTELSKFVAEVANISHDVRLPYVGESAFAHKGGAHIDGVIKVRESFEHMNPEVVGNKRTFVVSDQAGKGTILEKLKNSHPHLDKKSPEIARVLDTIKEKEAQGYHFEAADGSFQLIVNETLGVFKQQFNVIGFRVIEEKRENDETYSEATIKIEEGGREVHVAADGDGPVNALDSALRKALSEFFPSIKDIRLDDYKVRVLEENRGTAANVRVLIETTDGTDRWGTIGVSENIIEASWLALIDSVNYKLMKDASASNSPRKGA